MIQHPSVPTTDGSSWVDEFDAPNDLAADERAIWLKQAPLAFENGTLTKSSAFSFERYCKMAAVERRMAVSEDVAKGDHRGLQKQLNVLELQFKLTPAGKPLADARPAIPEAPASKLSRFRKTGA